MSPEEFRSLYELEEHHWWFVGMRKITAALLDRLVPSGRLRILDAGCGTGYMLSWLERYSGKRSVSGVDIDPDALHFCSQRGERSLVRASLTALPFPSDTFDLITSFDVLDELPAERAVLAYAELARVLRKGGLLFLRLPAFQWLYGEHDRAIGTVHRYTAAELAESLLVHGLLLERVTYANTLLFPFAVLWRWLHRSLRPQPRSDVRPLPRGLDWMSPLLAAALAIEAAWLRALRWRLPVGLSVMAIARKLYDRP